MSESTTRLLVADDFDSVIALDKRCEKLMGTDKPEAWDVNFSRVAMDFLVNKEDRKFLFGHFVGDQLIATMGMSFWQNLPYWSLVHYRIDPSRRSTAYNISKNGMMACMDTCIEFAESRNVFKWYYCRSLKSYRTISRFLSRAEERYGYQNVKRYSRFLEAVVPAGTLPKLKAHQSIVGNKKWPVDIVIAFASLNQEYRLRKLANPSDFSDFKNECC
jgi:hypothetical protein